MGIAFMVIGTVLCVLGFQGQVTELLVVRSETHPGIFFPFAKKVTRDPILTNYLHI